MTSTSIHSPRVVGRGGRRDRTPDETPDQSRRRLTGEAVFGSIPALAAIVVELEVDGDPGPLPASIDLGVYRILEEALASTGRSPLEVRLTFGERDLQLDVTAHGTPAAGWPTLAMRERVALCDGELEADEGRLRVRLPRAFEEVLV